MLTAEASGPDSLVEKPAADRVGIRFWEEVPGEPFSGGGRRGSPGPLPRLLHTYDRAALIAESHCLSTT